LSPTIKSSLPSGLREVCCSIAKKGKDKKIKREQRNITLTERYLQFKLLAKCYLLTHSDLFISSNYLTSTIEVVKVGWEQITKDFQSTHPYS
jgi:hypothetical protein